MLFPLFSPPLGPSLSRYVVSAGLDLGLGLGSITVPKSYKGVPIPILGGIKILDAMDFGTFNILPATGFPDCGKLCAGCQSQYAASVEEYRALAMPFSADKEWKESGGMPLAIVIPVGCGLLVLLVIIVIVAFVTRNRTQGGSARPSNPAHPAPRFGHGSAPPARFLGGKGVTKASKGGKKDPPRTRASAPAVPTMARGSVADRVRKFTGNSSRDSSAGGSVQMDNVQAWKDRRFRGSEAV